MLPILVPDAITIARAAAITSLGWAVWRDLIRIFEFNVADDLVDRLAMLFVAVGRGPIRSQQRPIPRTKRPLCIIVHRWIALPSRTGKAGVRDFIIT